MTDGTDDRAAGLERQAKVLHDVTARLHEHVGALSAILDGLKGEHSADKTPEAAGSDAPANLDDIEAELTEIRTSLDEFSPSSPQI